MSHDWSVRFETLSFCSRCGLAETIRRRRKPCVPVADPAVVISRLLKCAAIAHDAGTKRGRQGRWIPLLGNGKHK